MSTGLDCYFEEKSPRKWHLYLEKYDEREEYDEYGPFSSFTKAEQHLSRNFANPGGYSVEPHPDSDDKSWEWNDE